MANPIHVSGIPHKINTLRQQKQDRTRKGITVYFTCLTVKAKCFHFPLWGCFSTKFRNINYHHPFLSFPNQAHMTKLLQLLNVLWKVASEKFLCYAKTTSAHLYVYYIIPEILMIQEFTRVNMCFQESHK